MVKWDVVLVGVEEVEWELVGLDDVREGDVVEVASTEVPALKRDVTSPPIAPSTLDPAGAADTTAASREAAAPPTPSNPRFPAKEG